MQDRPRAITIGEPLEHQGRLEEALQDDWHVSEHRGQLCVQTRRDGLSQLVRTQQQRARLGRGVLKRRPGVSRARPRRHPRRRRLRARCTVQGRKRRTHLNAQLPTSAARHRLTLQGVERESDQARGLHGIRVQRWRRPLRVSEHIECTLQATCFVVRLTQRSQQVDLLCPLRQPRPPLALGVTQAQVEEQRHEDHDDEEAGGEAAHVHCLAVLGHRPRRQSDAKTKALVAIGVAVPCVIACRLSVGQHGVRLDHVFEALLGLVAGGLVGVVCARELTVGGAHGRRRALDLTPLRHPPRAALD